jgi:hypothetical protein
MRREAATMAIEVFKMRPMTARAVMKIDGPFPRANA